jgi:hypothetical protein
MPLGRRCRWRCRRRWASSRLGRRCPGRLHRRGRGGGWLSWDWGSRRLSGRRLRRLGDRCCRLHRCRYRSGRGLGCRGDRRRRRRGRSRVRHHDLRGGSRGSLRSSGLLGGALLDRLRLFGLLGSRQSVALGPTADAVCLRLLNARRVALRVDAQRHREIKRLFVRHAELFRELVQTDVLRHLAVSLSSFDARHEPRLDGVQFSHVPCIAFECRSQSGHRPRRDRSPECPLERPALRCCLEARCRWAQPRTSARCCAADDHQVGVDRRTSDQFAGGSDPTATDARAMRGAGGVTRRPAPFRSPLPYRRRSRTPP